MMPEYKGDAYLQSDFAAIKYSISRKAISKMYHCERIIHSNIGYVNRLRFYVSYVMDNVLQKNGFDEDVDIKPLLSWLPQIDKSLRKLWPNDVNPNEIVKCVLLKNSVTQSGIQKMTITIRNDGEREVEKSISLPDCIQIIKACLNAKLVDVIRNYIRMFGLSGISGISSGKQCAMHSSSTEKLCKAFMACITEVIQPSGYTDFKTSIDAVTGNDIIKRKNREEKQRRDRERHEESRRKYAEMKKAAGTAQ